MYVLRRTEDSKFVALPGSRHSYTQYLQKAQVFPSREAAEGNRCVENEYIVTVEEAMHGY